METKKIIAVIIVVIVVIAGGFVFYLQREAILGKKANSSKQLTQDQNQSQEINIENKTITDNTKPFKINITYPSIAGQDDFNRKAQNIVDTQLNDFKTYSLENDNLAKQTDPIGYAEYPREYYLEINYDKGLINSDTISTVFTISNYTGGAHGANYFVSLNYDLKNNKDIQLSDLFPGQPDYLQKISDFSIQNLAAQMQAKIGGTDGAW
ncbi:MAG: DUF4163 domain-containing protein, partial [Candidatus Staskawiczbacteria bacterium]|nr:DUF4163 domain-containing protein [Candidatus Staskawiczbacteria bacterium]